MASPPPQASSYTYEDFISHSATKVSHASTAARAIGPPPSPSRSPPLQTGKPKFGMLVVGFSLCMLLFILLVARRRKQLLYEQRHTAVPTTEQDQEDEFVVDEEARRTREVGEDNVIGGRVSALAAGDLD